VRIASSVNAVIFVALNFSVDGMKSKSWWRSIWMMITYSHENGRLKISMPSEPVQPSVQVRLIRAFCGPLGKGILGRKFLTVV
jgi:hypothetical protein